MPFTTRLPFLALTIVLGLGVGCTQPVLLAGHPLPAHPQTAASARLAGGPVMVIGGGTDQDDLMLGWMALAGGKSASTLIIPLASDNPVRSGQAYVDYLKELGCERVSAVIPHGPMSAADRQAVAGARGFFFSGGDQARIFKGLTPEWRQAIRDGWQRGAAIAGTSAGAMVWGPSTIMGGDPQETAWHGDDPKFGGIRLQGGLGLLPWAIVDTHFSERGRLPRLSFAVAKTVGTIGIGVDPQTAAIFRPDGGITVQGRGTVTVVRVPPQPLKLPLSLRGMDVSILAAGDRTTAP